MNKQELKISQDQYKSFFNGLEHRDLTKQLTKLSLRFIFQIFLLYNLKMSEKIDVDKIVHNHKNSVQDKWSESEFQDQNDAQQHSFREFLKKQKLRKRKEKVKYFKKVKNSGFWSQQQNLLYLTFLKYNKDSFVSQKCKRSSKIFRKMSSQIKTRSSLQCRSHHQKYSAIYSNVDQIINVLNKKLMNYSSQKLKTRTKPVSQSEPQINGELQRANIRQINSNHIFRRIEIINSIHASPQRDCFYRVKIQMY